MKKELLRVGTWNKVVKVSLARLTAIAKNFNNDTGKTVDGYRVPMFLGHPDDPSKAPAKGWLSKVWVTGQSLFGEFSDITEQTTNEIKEKIFKDVSVGILKTKLLHIALTNTPAVSNLGDFFNKDDEPEIIINLSQIKEEEHMDPKLQDAMNEIATLKAEKVTLGEQLTAEKATVTELTAIVETGKTALADSEKKLDEKVKELDALTKAGEESAEKLANDQDGTFVDGLIKDKKLKPVEKDITLINLKAHRGNTEELSFKDSEGKDVKMTALDQYKQTLSAADEVIESGEQFLGGGEKLDAKESKLDKLTKEYADKNKCDFQTAGLAIMDLHPELNQGA